MNKKIRNTIIIFLGVVMLMIVLPRFYEGTAYNYNQDLLKQAEAINKNCPMMLDSGTRLDGVLVLRGNILAYKETVTIATKEQINLEKFKSLIEPKLINQVKSDPDLKPNRDASTTFEYDFSDKDGVFMLKVTITPEQYK
jgi:hypothetical protein